LLHGYLQRNTTMVKQTSASSTTAPLTAPYPGWMLTASRAITIANEVYSRGEIVPFEAMRNAKAMIDSGAIAWGPTGRPHTPRPLPPPAPPARPHPRIEIGGDDLTGDPIEAVRRVLARYAEHGVPAKVAMDLMIASDSGASLL